MSPYAANLRGILAMCVAMILFVSGDAIVKTILAELPLGQIIAVRSLTSITLMLAVAAWTGTIALMHLLASPRLFWRSVLDIGSSQLFFTALTYMTFADVMAINQFTPLAITAGAAIFFAEPVGWRRWLATLAGLVGVLLIIRPGTSAFNVFAIAILLNVLCVAARDLITRSIGTHVPTDLIALSTLAAVGLSGIARLPIESWRMMTISEFLLLQVSGLFICGGYYCAVIAMRVGEVSVVGPFRYIGILLALAYSYFLFSEVPEPVTMIGIAIVIAAGLYTLHRERIRARQSEPKSRSGP